MITTEASPKVTHNEIIKEATPTLAGAIARTLADPDSDRFSEDDVQFMKFHGIYQQDDRDLRKTGKKFIFMIRGRIPGGVLSPKGYLVYDDLATKYGNNTLRITSRQSFQFHGVVNHCLGYSAIEEGGKIIGYNISVGGGQGRTHGLTQTYPRLADVIAFVTPDQLVEVSRGVLTVHRDFGDRTDRKHARLKYVLEEKGAAWFRDELEARIGYKLADAKPFKFTRQGDTFGWGQALDG